jgi:hypothetical protein
VSTTLGWLVFGVIRVIEEQITTLRPYNGGYTGDNRLIFRKAMWRLSPVYQALGALCEEGDRSAKGWQAAATLPGRAGVSGVGGCC